MQRLLFSTPKHTYRLLFLITIIALFSSSAFSAKFVSAGPPIVNIEKIGKNKLNGINQIMQDSLGFIWLIKKDGLFRYDSKEVRQFPGHEQFSSDRVTDLVEGRPGQLWIATRTNGLVHFDTYTAELTFHNLKETFELNNSGNEVDQLTYKNNTLYLASKNQLLLIDEQSLTVKKRLPLPIADSDFLVDIMLDSTGGIWISSLGSNGVSLLKNGAVRNYQHNSLDATTIGSKYIPTGFEDSKGRLWFGTIKGLSLYSPETDSFSNFQPLDMSLEEHKDLGAYANVLTSIVEDSEGALWLGLFHNGLVKFDPKAKIFEHLPRKQGVNSTVLDNSIEGGLFIDDQETLWILNRKGISQLDKNNKKFNQWGNTDANSNNDCTPLSIHEFNEKVYFECFNTLNIIAGNEVSQLLKIKDKIRNISHTSNDLVWLGTMGGGVYRHNLKTKQTKQYLFASTDATHANSVKQLRPDVNNILYGITNDHPEKEGSGIIRYDALSDSFIQFPTELELIDFVDIDNKKMLLITSYSHYEKALYWFDKENQKTKELPIVTGEIFAALKWHNSIWLSTQKLGIIVLDPNTGKIQQLNTELIRTINGFYLDSASEQLYLSTAEHFFHVSNISATSIDTLCVTCKLNLEYQGINHGGTNQFVSSNAALLSGGHFFISAKNILLSFSLDGINSEERENRLRFTGFKVLNKHVFPNKSISDALLTKSIEYTQELTIPPGINLFSFNFAHVDFLNNKQTDYRYKLEGFNKHWIETDSDIAEAVYSLLPAGSYTFKAMTRNPLGEWNEDPKAISLDIKVLPQWWQTWWAYSLYLLIVVSIVSLFFWLYSRKKIADNAKNSAFELAQSKENLFANLSHEFRTPLTLILGPAKVIETKSDDVTINKNVNLIERNALRLLSIIDQILQLAQLKEVQKGPSTAQQVSKVCHGVLQSFEAITREKQLFLKLGNSIDNSWWVPGTQNALETILNNLLTNAVKYTPAGGNISLDVREQGQWLEFSVSDTGSGIAKNEQNKIFERFTRLENSQNHVPGVGIGLALVKELVDTLGGEISVNSQLNSGSTFLFTLPKVQAARDQISGDNESDVIANMNKKAEALSVLTECRVDKQKDDPTVSDIFNNHNADASKPSLLIVEDNHEMRAFIKDGLKNDYLILEASNGQEGFSLACEQSPDIIISDVMMPNIDGLELLETLKGDELTNHIPIILLTAKGSDESKIKGLQLHADDYMSKPFNEGELSLRL
jgi:signal transduction histidine kinase/CheY-like chemotaxis protein/ligand-binding sensor domain-containing protein